MLGIVVNWWFFYQWYRGEDQKLATMPREKQVQQTVTVSPDGIITRKKEVVISKLPWLKKWEQTIKDTIMPLLDDHTEKMAIHGDPNSRRPQRAIKMPLRDNIMVLPMSGQILNELQENTLFWHLTKLDNERVIYSILDQNKTITLATVTHFVDTQQRLTRIWIIALLFFGAGTFLIARLFVRNSLKRLRDLTHFVHQIDIHKLEKRLALAWPEDDELRQISFAINSSLDTIQQQTNALKDFVSYASHELKTPLMAMSTNLDLVEKTQDFSSFLIKQKSQLKRMHELFEKLLLITKQEFHEINFKKENIVPIIQTIIDQVWERFPTKKGDIFFEHSPVLHLKIDMQLFEIIVSNLLINACKYSEEGSLILIQLSDTSLQIKDHGIGIAPEHLPKIWERFWKKGGDWYWLGLYLVKLLVEKHGWKIDVESIVSKTTTFTISF